MTDYVAICHTPDCANSGQQVVVSWDPEWGPEPLVSCGVCAQQITDVTPPEVSPA